MTRDEAFGALASENATHRLEAARALRHCPSEREVAAIRDALARETVPWIRRALRDALDDTRPVTIGAPPTPDTGGDSVARGIRSTAIRETTATLVHEVESVVGLVRYEAMNEVPDFDHSKTRRKLDQLNETLDAIRQLGEVQKVPSWEDVEIAALVDESIASIDSKMVSTSLRGEGPRPLVCRADRPLLRMAVSNCIRNAVDAVRSAGRESEVDAIVVTWGITDRDAWVSVVDHGAGLHGGPRSKFTFGATTKSGGRGAGLVIAAGALAALGGSVTLEPRQTGGCRADLRWRLGAQS